VSIPAAQSRSIASCSAGSALPALVAVAVAVGADRRLVPESERELGVAVLAVAALGVDDGATVPALPALPALAPWPERPRSDRA
jgi:hypothetical protein